jgi:peptidylprolyl isomerase
VKYFAPIGVLAISLALTACGSGGDSSTVTPNTAPQSTASSRSNPAPADSHSSNSSQHPKLSMSKAEIAKLPKLEIGVPSTPVPKRLVINDLRKGTGAAVKQHDAVLVRYFSVSYAQALKKSRSGRYGPSRFGMNEVVDGWKLGLPGMRVGGRRELIVPPKLHFRAWKPEQGYPNWTTIYVIDLLGVEKGGAGSF